VRRESFALIGGAACAFGYALLAGYSVPTQRTVLMLLAGLAWRGLARSSTPASALGAATVAVLATDPFAVLAAGFWLSFGAVAVILWREAARLRPPDGIRGALRLQAVITAALTPATLANFSSVSLGGLLVNPLAIPLFSFVLVPLVLVTAALLLLGLPAVLGAVPLWLADRIATPAVAWLTRMSHLPGGLWQVDPQGWWYAFAAVGCLLLILPVGWRARLLALATALPLLCEPARPPPGNWRALALDAGGAPLVLVVTSRHALLYGTGDRFGTAGGRVATLLEPAARSLGVHDLDLLVVGGLDRDVAAGIGAVQARLAAGRIVGGATRDGERPPHVEDCAGIGRWQWDGVTFALQAAQPPARGCTLTVRAGDAQLSLEPAPLRRQGRRGALLSESRPDGAVHRYLSPGPGIWHADR
jgi:competence protein ComEC